MVGGNEKMLPLVGFQDQVLVTLAGGLCENLFGEFGEGIEVVGDRTFLPEQGLELVMPAQLKRTDVGEVARRRCFYKCGTHTKPRCCLKLANR